MKTVRRRIAALLAFVMVMGSLTVNGSPVYASEDVSELIAGNRFDNSGAIALDEEINELSEGISEDEGLEVVEDDPLFDSIEEESDGNDGILMSEDLKDGVFTGDMDSDITDEPVAKGDAQEIPAADDMPETETSDPVKFYCGSYIEESGYGDVAVFIETDKAIKYHYTLELIRNGSVIASISSNGRKDTYGNTIDDAPGYKIIRWHFVEAKPDTVRFVISGCDDGSLNGEYTFTYRNNKDDYPKSGTWYTSNEDHGKWSVDEVGGTLLIEGLGNACSCVQSIGDWHTGASSYVCDESDDFCYAPWALATNLDKLSNLKITGRFNSTKQMTGVVGRCGIKAADLTGLKMVGELASMEDMFSYCSNLKSIDFGDSLDTATVICMNNMFCSCSSLESLDLSELDMSGVTESSNMFQNCSSLVSIKAPKNVKKAIDLPGAGWYEASSGKKVNAIPANVAAGSEYRFSFAGSGTIDSGYLKGISWSMDENGVMRLTGTVSANREEELSGGLSGDSPLPNYDHITKAIVEIKNAKNLSALFWECKKLREVDLTKLDTSQVWNMYGMFYDCTSLSSVDLGKMDMNAITGNVIGYINGTSYGSLTGVDDFFYNCSSLTNIKAPKNLKYDINLPTFEGYKDYTWKYGGKEAPAGKYSGQYIPAKVAAGTVFTREKSSVTPAPAVETEQAEKPLANHASGNLKKNTRISLSSETQGADIYYTMNGGNPEFGSDGKPGANTLLYSNAIILDKDLTIRAIAVKGGFKNSEVAEYSYNITTEWGDITEDNIKKLFGYDSSKVPETMWYLFKGDTYRFYTKAGETDLKRTYTGSAITFNNDICVFYGTARLWENRDYTLVYANNVKVADKGATKAPMVTVKGKGNYAGLAAFKFTISGADISRAEITSEPVVAVAAGTKLDKIKPTAEFDGKKLVLNRDYDLVYYEGNADEKNRKDPTQTVAAADKSYIIRLAAHKGGCFAGEKTDNVVTVKTFDAGDKNVVRVKGLKVTIPKQPWSGKAISINTLFDNSGSADAPAKVMNGKTRLVYGTDFTVISDKPSYTDAGKYRIIIRGKAAPVSGNGVSYIGDQNAVLEISGTPSGKVKIACLSTTVEYNNGNSISLNDLYKKDKNHSSNEVTLYTKQGGTVKKLTQGTDYDYSFINTGSLGKTELEFTLKGGYSGIIRKKITVKPYNISNKKDIRKKITVSCAKVEFSKAGAVPEVTVRYGDTVLTEGTDYRLSFKNNAKASTGTGKSAPTVYVGGIGNYTGTYTQSFAVDKADVRNVKLVVADKDYKKSKGNFKVTPKLMDNGKAISQGRDKDIEKLKASDFYYYYADSNKPVENNATVSANTLIRVCVRVTCSDKSSYKATSSQLLSGYYRIIEPEKNISRSKVELLKPGVMVYSGNEEIIPLASEDIKVTMDKGKTELKPGTEYEIRSIKDNRFVGTATITIAGKGKYGGTKSFKVKIKARSL